MKVNLITFVPESKGASSSSQPQDNGDEIAKFYEDLVLNKEDDVKPVIPAVQSSSASSKGKRKSVTLKDSKISRPLKQQAPNVDQFFKVCEIGDVKRMETSRRWYLC